MCGHTPNSIIGNNGTAEKADEVWEGADPQPEKNSNTPDKHGRSRKVMQGQRREYEDSKLVTDMQGGSRKLVL